MNNYVPSSVKCECRMEKKGKKQSRKRQPDFTIHKFTLLNERRKFGFGEHTDTSGRAPHQPKEAENKLKCLTAFIWHVVWQACLTFSVWQKSRWQIFVRVCLSIMPVKCCFVVMCAVFCLVCVCVFA